MRNRVVELDRSALASGVEAPGVTVVHWRDKGNPESYALDRAIERAAREYPEIRFGGPSTLAGTSD